MNSVRVIKDRGKAGVLACLTMVLSLLPQLASATASPYTSLVAAVDFADTTTQMVAVAALLAGLIVVGVGVSFILRMISKRG